MSLPTFQAFLLAILALLLAVPVLLTARLCRRSGCSPAVALLVLVPGVNVALFYWLAIATTPARARPSAWPAGGAERREVLRAVGLAPVALLAFKARLGVAAELDVMSRDAMARIGGYVLAEQPQLIRQACILAQQMSGKDFPEWRRLAVSASRSDLDAGNTAVLHGFVLPRGLLDVCAGWSVASKGSRHAG